MDEIILLPEKDLERYLKIEDKLKGAERLIDYITETLEFDDIDEDVKLEIISDKIKEWHVTKNS